jgi:transcriptional regulator with XRE-family HTH domain
LGQNLRKKSPEMLRLKFWEVAPSASAQTASMTPFDRIRNARNIDTGEIAKRMGWEVSDYTKLENGNMRASAETILAFCRAAKCHPLDLYYPEAGAETPLPREIFYSLVAMIEVPGFSDHDRARSQSRLNVEHRRATTMVLANRDYLRPLLTAIGYSPDLKTYRAPLYDTSKNDEGVAVREVIDMSLLENQMLLENDLNTYQAIHERARKAFSVNEKIMLRKAGALFGAQRANAAIAALSGLLDQWDDKKALERAFKQAPDIVGTIIQKGEDINPAQVLGDKRVFFQAVKRHTRQAPLLEEMEAHVREAGERLKSFMRWYESDRTGRLLDWCEDCEILKDFSDQPQPVRKNNLKPGTHSMPG